MQGYIIRRILSAIPTVLLVGTIVFFIVHLAPGDPVLLLVGEPEEANDWQMIKNIEEIRAKLGLDKPLPEQYWRFMWRTLQFDLGTSIFHGDTVATIFKQRFWPTISIVLLSKIFALSVAIPLGVVAAYKANSIWDRAIMVYVVAGFSIPGYFLAYILIFTFAVKLGWFPAIGYTSLAEGVGPWSSHLVLPIVSLAMVGSALTTRITRSTMLEVLREDYIRTARAKGLASTTVLVRHALKNASIPIVTIIGLGLATLIGGVVLIEVVFAIPGMGRATVEAMLRRDYPVIQGLILIVGLTFVVINLLTDILYAYLDPRIRYS